MLFKKLKKIQLSELAVLLAALALTAVVAACPGDDLGGGIDDDNGQTVEEVKNYISGDDALAWGVSTQADAATLGLTPGNDTTEIYLNWYSSGSQSGKSAQVRFVRGTFTEGKELLAEATKSVSEASTGNTAHKATVTGLKPDSSYQYAVSSDGTNWSDVYDFKVPAAAGAFKFAIVADPQLTKGNVDANSRYPAAGTTTAAGWIETMRKIVSANVSFIASCGDQVDKTADGDEVEYNNFFAPPGLRNLPVAPTAGNHDTHLPFGYHFNVPNKQNFETETADTAKGRNYYYRYNNILFVVLNTAPYPASTAEAKPHVTRFDDTLKTAKAAHAGKYDWLIVQHHKSTASVGDHVADRDIQYYVEAGFEKVMSDHKVDFVLAGHDHVYARSYPLSGRDDGKVSVPDKTRGGNEISSPNDPIYLTFTTGSGLKYYAVSSDPTFDYKNTLYVKDNAAYPYLGEVTNANGDSSTSYGSTAYMSDKKLPVSNAAYVQPYIPSYSVVEVNGKTITFKTYAIATVSGTSSGASAAYNFDANTPYDWVTVTK